MTILEARINNRYFEWMYELACGDKFRRDISFRRLFEYLHSVEFVYSIPRDINRAEDGIDLRYRFALSEGDGGLSEFLDGPCSVLEMMLALAINCEEHIMDDPYFGDRTGQWFWGMVSNLGLGGMTDDRFDECYVEECIVRLLRREYEPDGKGGLFTVRHCTEDLRDVEIWHQLCWYLNNIA